MSEELKPSFEIWFNKEYPLPAGMERGPISREFKAGCEKAYITAWNTRPSPWIEITDERMLKDDSYHIVVIGPTGDKYGDTLEWLWFNGMWFYAKSKKPYPRSMFITHYRPTSMPVRPPIPKGNDKKFNCRHFKEDFQSVPIPFGNGMCSEPLGDCLIESESKDCTVDCLDYEETVPKGGKEDE